MDHPPGHRARPRRHHARLADLSAPRHPPRPAVRRLCARPRRGGEPLLSRRRLPLDLSLGIPRLLSDHRLGGPLRRRRRLERAERVDARRGRSAAPHPVGPAPGLRLRGRPRCPLAPRVVPLARVIMTGWPVLSVITWLPFAAAVLIMFTARHRPRLVRWLSVVSTGLCLVLSIAIYVAYDRDAAGFQR